LEDSGRELPNGSSGQHRNREIRGSFARSFWPTPYLSRRIRWPWRYEPWGSFVTLRSVWRPADLHSRLGRDTQGPQTSKTAAHGWQLVDIAVCRGPSLTKLLELL